MRDPAWCAGREGHSDRDGPSGTSAYPVADSRHQASEEGKGEIVNNSPESTDTTWTAVVHVLDSDLAHMQRIHRVRLEPELEEECGSMRPIQRRKMARKLYRWAKQLWISAAIIEADEQPKPKAQLKRLARAQLARN